MNKKLLVAIVFILSIGFIYFNTNKESPNDLLQKKHAAFLKSHPFNTTLALSKKERKARGITPNKYFEQEYLLEMNPNTGRTHPENVYQEFQETQETICGQKEDQIM